MQKLGINHGRYLGETLELPLVLDQIALAAKTHGWRGRQLFERDGLAVMAWHRPAANAVQPARRIYLSAGIHGDEPAGPLAALRLLQDNAWPPGMEIWLLPCLNPAGFQSNQRENADGVDLNRDYRHPKTAECRAHIAWLSRQSRFDAYLCLHEDWESHGFYLYEQNPGNRPSLAALMIAAARQVCPIDPSETIEGRAACGGVIRPNIQPQDRPDWPEAFYLITHLASLGYTLEAPSDFPLATRVAALTAAASAALQALAPGVPQTA